MAYRVGMNYALALGDPVGPEDEIEGIINGFVEFCNENDWGFGFHQTSPDFLSIYSRLGLKKLKIGDDAIVDLTQFTTERNEMKKMRGNNNKLEKLGTGVTNYFTQYS